jgi:hypothetical protein
MHTAHTRKCTGTHTDTRTHTPIPRCTLPHPHPHPIKHTWPPRPCMCCNCCTPLCLPSRSLPRAFAPAEPRWRQGFYQLLQTPLYTKAAKKQQCVNVSDCFDAVDEEKQQGCVIRSFGTFNTVKYACNTIVFLGNFGSAVFLPKMDPICRKIIQNFPNSFPIYYMSLIYYITALLTEWPLLGRKLPKKAQKRQKGNFCNRIIRLNFCQYGKIMLNTIRHIIRIRSMTHP